MQRIRIAPLGDIWQDALDLVGAGGATKAVEAAGGVVATAKGAAQQSADIVAHFAESQDALIRLDKNVEAMKPLLWGALIVSGVSLAIIAYKSFR